MYLKPHATKPRVTEEAPHSVKHSPFMTFHVSETVRATGEQREQRGIERYTFEDGKLATKDLREAQWSAARATHVEDETNDEMAFHLIGVIHDGFPISSIEGYPQRLASVTIEARLGQWERILAAGQSDVAGVRP